MATLNLIKFNILKNKTPSNDIFLFYFFDVLQKGLDWTSEHVKIPFTLDFICFGKITTSKYKGNFSTSKNFFIEAPPGVREFFLWIRLMFRVEI